MRAYHNNGVNALGKQETKVVLLVLKLVAGTTKKGLITVFAKRLFDIVDRICQKGVGGVGAEDTDGMHGIQSEAPGENIRRISQFFHNGQYFFFCFVADVLVSV